MGVVQNNGGIEKQSRWIRRKSYSHATMSI